MMGRLTLFVCALAPAACVADDPIVTFHNPPKALATGAVAEDWPCFLGPNHNAVSAETKLLSTWPEEGPTLVWEMEIGEGYATPAVQGDRLVFFHRTKGLSHVDCVRAETGEHLWRFSYPTHYQDRYGFNGGPRSSPVIDGDRVYTMGAEGVLHCLDLERGQVVWRRDTSQEFSVPQNHFGVGSTPVIEGSLLIVQVGAPDGPCVVAFDKSTGKTEWKSGDAWTASYASPIPAEVHGRRRVFVFAGGDSRSSTGGLMSIDPANGRIDFRFPWRPGRNETVNAASPVIVGNRVFVTTSYGKGGAFLDVLADGSHRVLWTSDKLGAHWNTPVHREGYLYGFDGEKSSSAALVCLDLTTGKQMWRKVIEWTEQVERNGKTESMSFTPMRASLLWADGAFYCLGEMGHLLSLDLSPDGCRVIDRAWLFAARETYGLPVLSNGLLYVVQTRMGFRNRSPARLMCFDLRAAE